jgi:hypothetical protein
MSAEAFKIGHPVDELPESFPAQVWAKLSRVDVGDFIEIADVKNKEGVFMYSYSYLTWSWAWATLMQHYPDSEYYIDPEDWLDNGSVLVNVRITVRDSMSELTRFMWLPVMDKKNNSIQNPTTRQISDARMRCIVKCLAILGLGLDLWAGSDIPVGTVDDPLSDDKAKFIAGLFSKLDPKSQAGFFAWLGVDSLKEITEANYQKARKQLEAKIKAMR